MELKPGYKQTEVGVIPEEWDIVPVGSLFSFKNGLNKAKEFFGYGTPIVNYMDVFQYSGLLVKDIHGRVDANRNELKAYEVRKGDVFFTRTSETVEEIGIAAVMLDDAQDTVFSGFVLRARPTDDSLENEFKKYCFSARYYRQQVTSQASYTTRALTNGRSLSASLIARPPLPEQRAIAAALSDVDALIASLDKLIAKKRNMKQAAMQELLTAKRRLPGFSGEWEVKKLGEIATFFSGGTPPTSVSAYYGGDIAWITSGDLNKSVITGVSGRITKAGLENSSAKLIEENTLLIALYGATSGVTAMSKIRAAINQAVLAIVPKTDSSLFLFFKLSYLKDWIITTYTQGGQPNLSGDIVKAIEISFPPLPEQTAIAAILSDMDAEIAALEQKRDKTRLLKQGMMQELLTGRIRLV
ncbi:restriction endonuclease subunit S [Trichlorobacter lovleyi]|uniref:restriction endonuclease subunit S n=1 Tax=Trichlorobacter lovleyi TaxID=313985 RepID=UPI00223ECC54|nr:restriction endonuclease subunit S [Trichlorobacter lovleyi]QOX77625.1 restriction endonuclease subunit S [Trichlorobacter lovleyi]